MKATYRSKLLAIGLIILFALFSATGVAAAPPTKEPYTFTHSYVLGDCYEGADFFEIWNSYTETGWVTTFYDRDGNAVRIQTHAAFEDLFTNSVTGKSLAGSTQSTKLFEYPLDGASRFTGVLYHSVIPGVGTIVIDAGLIAYEPGGDPPLLRGKHQVLEGDLDDLCAALADP